MVETILGKTLAQWYQELPLLKTIYETEETLWINTKQQAFASVAASLPLTDADMTEASDRLQRFAPYIAKVFADTQAQAGLIESPLLEIPSMAAILSSFWGLDLKGKLLIKCDNQLPISGSIKARGGIYEVLKHAETLAIENQLLRPEDDYSCLDNAACKQLFSEHSIVVGSTGNLGLSIGIISAQLGFQVLVHMSADAKSWKKQMLRDKGVQVVEHEQYYSVAVEQGRLAAQSRPKCHFIDDENSTDLFLGYSVAALRLKTQLDQQGISVDQQHPLFVYLPCGVGGGPGGVAFGLKQVFGDHVHCFFAEPTHSPCMLLGMYTGLHDQVSVQDFAIDNKTCADGLAVGRPSAFVGRIMVSLLDGIYTISDDNLYRMVALIKDSEGINLEPSATAGLAGIGWLAQQNASYLNQHQLAGKMHNACHIAWATGGNMVPAEEQTKYYQTGRELLPIQK
jgi:D-serine dehydratase